LRDFEKFAVELEVELEIVGLCIGV
jgi:hypothetical protein